MTGKFIVFLLMLSLSSHNVGEKRGPISERKNQGKSGAMLCKVSGLDEQISFWKVKPNLYMHFICIVSFLTDIQCFTPPPVDPKVCQLTRVSVIPDADSTSF